MSSNVSSVSTQNTPTHVEALPEVVNSTFEERWAAWVAKGAEEDRKTRRRAMAGAAVVTAGLAVWLTIVLFG